MNDDQKARIENAMDAYELYTQTYVSTFTSSHIDAVAKVRKELGMQVSVCRGCIDDIAEYFRIIYEIYKR